ncbi:MAG: 16S rRNA (adenine(1518)-N(6)/adenine(1519)-N(6))-dimethyltransferase RsmA [Candidatus Aureabacteria bacterium]|nr:16S rRNA (adenine(1518)-N(6)/adenine(1519)-N(6))-dimethyltransferase RsmA [Candidatus Auribacterota bacterium]
MHEFGSVSHSLTSAKTLLSRLGVRASRKRGQSFLTSNGIAERIAALARLTGSDAVLEVGPGLGALTEHLVRASGRVIAVENDHRLVSWLRDVFRDQGTLEIIEADILELDLKDLFKRMGEDGRQIKVVSNIPYSISGPLIGKLLEASTGGVIVLTVQKELARRITASPANKDYGSFSIFCQYHAEVRRAFDVPPGAFFPRPEVTSSVLVFQPRRQPLFMGIDPEKFFAFVHLLFSQRRKAVSTILKRAMQGTLSPDLLLSAIKESGIDPGSRAEHLSLEQFGALHRLLAKTY